MAKVHNVNIGKIKALTAERGLKLKYFTDYFGKQKSYFADIKNGKNYLDEDQLVFIADKLGTTVEYLTDQTEQKEKPPAETDGELDPEVEEVLDLLFAMHPDDREQLLQYAQWLSAQREKRND